MALSQLAAKLRQDFGVRVPIRRLFEDLNSVSRIADHLLAEGAIYQLPRRASGRCASCGCSASHPAAEAGALPKILERLDRIEPRLPRAANRCMAARLPGVTPEPVQPAQEGMPLTASQREIWVAREVGGPGCFARVQ